MARTVATNYTGPLQFPYATAGTDLFKKEDVQTLALAVDQHDHSSGKGLVIPAASIVQPFLDLTVTRNTYHGTGSVNIIRPQASANGSLSIEATTGATWMSALSGNYITANAWHNGSTWQLFNTGQVSSYWNMNPTQMMWFSAPAGSTAWVRQFLVDAPNGNGYLGGGLLLNDHRLPNAGSLTLQTQQGSNSDATLFAENGAVYLWMGSTAGNFNVQQVGGGTWRGIMAGSIQANGTGSVINNDQGPIRAGNNIDKGIEAKGPSQQTRQLMWVDTGDTNVLTAGGSGQLRMVTYNNSAQWCSWTATGYTQNVGDITIGGAANSLWWGTVGRIATDGTNMLFDINGNWSFRTAGGGTTNFTVLPSGAAQTRGSFTVNIGRGANQGGVTFQSQSGGDYSCFCESGNFYMWGPNGVVVQGAGGSGWKPISASAFNVNSAAAGKASITPIVDPLAIVMDDTLHGVSYSDVSGETPISAIGFVADAWLLVVPEVVAVNDAGEPQGMDYAKVGSITFEALKNLTANVLPRLDALEAKVAV